MVVSGLLQARWSPRQIAALSPQLYPDQQAMRVSHETIYRSLFVQARGELRQELARHLRSGRSQHKRSRRGSSAIDADIDIYFADPHSPRQRGSNENTNGLLRQYWPKGSDMRHLTQADCDEVALSLNTRPRQTLGWNNPHEAPNQVLRATTT